MKQNIEEQREVNKTRALQQQATLQTLQVELDERKKEADAAEEKLEDCRNVINKLLEGIAYVFKLLKCDNNPVLQLLGSCFVEKKSSGPKIAPTTEKNGEPGRTRTRTFSERTRIFITRPIFTKESSFEPVFIFEVFGFLNFFSGRFSGFLNFVQIVFKLPFFFFFFFFLRLFEFLKFF